MSNFIEVESTNLKAVRHYPLSMALDVVFRSRTDICYTYSNVSSVQFAEMLMAESPGAWFYRNIREHPEVHPYTKTAIFPL